MSSVPADETIAEAFQAFACNFQRIDIAVDTEQSAVGGGRIEKGFRVTARAEGAIDIPAGPPFLEEGEGLPEYTGR